jgi:hypothetical protein
MANFLPGVCILGLGAFGAAPEPPRPETGPETLPHATGVVERGPHHNLVATTRAETDFEGRPVAVPGRYVQLEDGLNYWDEEQQAWAEAVAEIELVNGVGVARRGQQRVLFAPNVNEPDGAITLATSEGVLLRSSVLALAYYDAASGKDAALAVARDAPGELLPPNRLVYRDAFTGLKADVVYTYRKSGLEQDVILRESPPDPEEFGLRAEATRLEVLTEFFGAPEPVKRARGARPGGRSVVARGDGRAGLGGRGTGFRSGVAGGGAGGYSRLVQAAPPDRGAAGRRRCCWMSLSSASAARPGGHCLGQAATILRSGRGDCRGR